MTLRWEDVGIGSIWREKSQRADGRLIRVLEVSPPDGPEDKRLVSVKIVTVVKRDAWKSPAYPRKRGASERWTTVDRLGRDFEFLCAEVA